MALAIGSQTIAFWLIGKLVKLQKIFFEPGAVGLLTGRLFFNLVVLDNSLPMGINKEHLPRFKPAGERDVRRLNLIQDPHLRGHHRQVIFSHNITRRAQAVLSKTAPILIPSLKAIAAGPSPGSLK